MTRVITIALIAACCVLALAAAYPAKGEGKHVKPIHDAKRKHPTAIAGGYASTHGGEDDEDAEKDEPEQDDEEEEPQDDAEDEEEPTPAPVKPTRAPRGKPVKPEGNKKRNNGGVHAVATSIARGAGAVSNSRAFAIDGDLPAELKHKFH